MKPVEENDVKPKKSKAVKSVRNAMRALELFSEEMPTISVSMVSEHLEIPKSSASRLLSAMKHSEIVDQEKKGGLYKPGFLAYRLGLLYSINRSSRDIVRAGMQELATATRHSCWISALSGSDIVVLEGVHGGYPIRLVVEAGSRLPAHATAAGKALLSRLSDAQIRVLYPGRKLPAFTSRTLRNVNELLREIAEVRRLRWAETRQEVIDGIKSIGVSFLSPDDVGNLALSVSFPVTNVSGEEEIAVRTSLLRIAQDLGRKLGDKIWLQSE